MRAVLTWWSAFTFLVLWFGFFVVVVVDPDGMESIDAWLERQPVVVRVVLWVLFMPIVIGVKAWTSSSAAIRWCGFAALVMWTAASAASVKRLVTD